MSSQSILTKTDYIPFGTRDLNLKSTQSIENNKQTIGKPTSGKKNLTQALKVFEGRFTWKTRPGLDRTEEEALLLLISPCVVTRFPEDLTRQIPVSLSEHPGGGTPVPSAHAQALEGPAELGSRHVTGGLVGGHGMRESWVEIDHLKLSRSHSRVRSL